jgi:hypothetical protein
MARSGSPETVMSPLTAAKWLVHVLAVVFGLGATAYAIGAAVLWIRFQHSPWPRDVAVEHASRVSVIALGVPPALGVAALVSVYVGMLVLRRTDFRAARRKVLRSWPGAQNGARIVVAVWVAAVVLLGLRSWWGSIVTAGVGLLLLLGSSYVRPLRVTSVANAALVLGSFAIVFLGAVGLEYSASARVPAVVLHRPLPVGLQQSQLTAYLDGEKPAWQIDGGVPLPYFGQDDSNIYVGKIDSIIRDQNGGWRINFCPNGPPREIVAVPLTAVKTIVYAGSEVTWNLFNRRLPPLQQLFGATPKQFRLTPSEVQECKALGQL